MIYVDFDGVLAPFKKDKSIEEVASAGYTLTLEPVYPMCQAVRALNESGNVRVLSAVINDGAARDKYAWLSQYVDKQFADNAIFVPYGKNKSETVKATSSDFLIDDFSKNLHEWNGVGIKVYNGINGNNGTWRGYSVHVSPEHDWKVIYNQLRGIVMSQRN